MNLELVIMKTVYLQSLYLLGWDGVTDTKILYFHLDRFFVKLLNIIRKMSE